MNFRDQMKLDVQKVFLNPLEFSELHFWASDSHDENPRQTLMVVEFFTFDGKPISYAEGISVHNATVHVDPAELGYYPRQGEFINLDSQMFEIVGVGNEFGMLKIILKGYSQ